MGNKREQTAGGSCMYLGQRYPLMIQIDREQKKPQITFDGTQFLCVTSIVDESGVSSALQSFYKRTSRKIIEERLRLYQPQIRIKYRSVTIKERVTQWGSCSSNRHLTFHWRLILFPIEAVDYVVVHELCHLKHMNHDRSFWRLVGSIYPKYKDAMAMLQGSANS